MRCSEQSAESGQLKGCMGGHQCCFWFGQAEPQLRERGRRGALEPCLWDCSAFSSFGCIALPHRNPLQYNHPSHHCYQVFLASETKSTENVKILPFFCFSFFPFNPLLSPLFCLSFFLPAGTRTECLKWLWEVILNYFEGQAVCFWMERMNFFRTSCFAGLYQKYLT